MATRMTIRVPARGVQPNGIGQTATINHFRAGAPLPCPDVFVSYKEHYTTGISTKKAARKNESRFFVGGGGGVLLG